MSHHRLFLVTFAVVNDIIHLRNLYIYPAYMKVETFVEESLISLHMSPTPNALIILGFAHPSSSLVSDEFWLICFVHQRYKKTSLALCLSDSTFWCPLNIHEPYCCCGMKRKGPVCIWWTIWLWICSLSSETSSAPAKSLRPCDWIVTITDPANILKWTANPFKTVSCLRELKPFYHMGSTTCLSSFHNASWK